MVTNPQRYMVKFLVWLGVWWLDYNMRLICVNTRRGTTWFLRWMKKRQVVDDLHHAPCCPANHYHKQRLVFRPCTCGAVDIEDKTIIERR